VSGLDFSITMYGPTHFASSLPVFSVWGLRKRTRLPTSSSHSLTFGSLYVFVSSWYFCKLATTLSMSGFNKSFSSSLLGHTGASIAIRNLRYFTSSDSTSSAPYINQNGVKFVALQTVVLWLHIALGMTSAHLPFVLPSSIFLIALNIKVLGLSTALLD
jgi:hypothetical protein